MDNCIFCKIINKEMPATIIYEDDEFMAVFDKFPATLGHILVLPKNHFETIFKIPTDVSGKLFTLATKIAQHMETTLNIESLNILQNNGEIAGQTIDHVHVHLIPRYKDDGVIIKSKNEEISNEKINELLEQLNFI